MASEFSALSFHSQLKSFCDGIENDAKKLRQMTSKTAGQNRKRNIKDQRQRQQQEQITMQELYMKCKSLHEVSESMMTALENEMNKFVCKDESSEMSPVVENKENTINDCNVNNSTVEHGPVNTNGQGDISLDASIPDFEEELFIDPALMDTSIVEVGMVDDEAPQPQCTQQESDDNEEKEKDTVSQGEQRSTLCIETEEEEEKEERVPKSPARRKSSVFDADGPKTPSLADMKLSKATYGALKFRHYSTSDSDDMSPVEKKLLSSVHSTPKSPAVMEKSVFLNSSSKPTKNTPRQSNNNNKYQNSCETPPTPEIVSDFATCSLQEVTCSLHPAVMEYLENNRGDLDVLNEPAITKTESPREINQETSAPKTEVVSKSPAIPAKSTTTYDSDEEDMDDGIKTKILKTRRDADGKASEDWIPMIEASEWEKAPMSLKVQIASADILNAGIASLNKFIFAHQNKRDESFTLEEMTTIVSSEIDSLSVNVFALSLVHLKRLDLAMENSIRVYKVKRFY